MTFTEAAVEVLRRAGKPLHYKEIAEAAVRESLLSHVGQDPETTMGQRLAAMARREEERRVVAINPEGTFALTEWSVPAELVVEAKPPPELGDDGEKPYRGREREPRPIHAQARRRMEAIASGEEPQEERGERGGDRRDERKDDRKERDERRDRKRPPVPAEAVFDWLAQKQAGAQLSEVAADLAAKNIISSALAQDLPSLTAALLEDNRRRTEAGRKPAFIVDGERVTLVEFPALEKLAEVAHSPQSSLGRPASANALVQEGRRACVRALRARLAELETSGFEHVCAALLDKMGMRDLRVAKRSKEGPLYLARQRWGLSDLRVAVRLVRGKREISRQDVIELRKDLAHYSAQMAILLSAGEAGREARTDASAAAQAPVALFAGEALAEELVEKRVGVTVQVVEIADVDEAFFAAARAQKGGREPREGGRPPEGSPAELSAPVSNPPAASSESAPANGEAPAPAPSESAPAAAPVNPGPGSAASSAAPSAPGGDEKRTEERERRRRRDRDERPKLSSPADQAWGQPAGTPRKGLELSSEPPRADASAEASSDAAPANGEPAASSEPAAVPAGDSPAAASGHASAEPPSSQSPADPAADLSGASEPA